MHTQRTVLRGGLVVDGFSPSAFLADVVIDGGVIDAVIPAAACPETWPEHRVIDCTGRAVAPGFVDIHTHSDLSLLAYPGNESRISQGITTEVVGNCGMSAAPTGEDPDGLTAVIATIDVVPGQPRPWSDVAGWLRAFAAAAPATNVLAQVGHGSARFAVAGSSAQPLDDAGLAALDRELGRALEAGCVGVSVGLMYPPGEVAGRDELVRVAAVAARHDAVLSAHLRDYDGATLAAAVEEILTVAATAGARLQISHLRRLGAAGRFADALERIERARAGQDVAADAYPYIAGHTTLTQLLPPTLRSLGPLAIAAEARHAPDAVAEALAAADYPAEAITVMKAARTPDAVGLTAGDVDADPWRWLTDLLASNDALVDVAVVAGDWADVDLALRTSWISIASDGTALAAHHRESVPHPRSWGAFPQAFRRMRALGVSLEEAIRRMTAQPAARVGLDRTLRPGRAADVVVFDELGLDCAADYTRPAVAAVGIDHVFVNGVNALRAGSVTAHRGGRVLTGGGVHV